MPVERRRPAVGSVSLDTEGNDEMIKASISLQDLRRRLYVKAKTEKRSISRGEKLTGKRSAGNPHAAFDEAGTGNVAWSRYCDTRQPKGASNGEYKHRPTPARQSSTLLSQTVECS